MMSQRSADNGRVFAQKLQAGRGQARRVRDVLPRHAHDAEQQHLLGAARGRAVFALVDRVGDERPSERRLICESVSASM